MAQFTAAGVSELTTEEMMTIDGGTPFPTDGPGGFGFWRWVGETLGFYTDDVGIGVGVYPGANDPFLP